MFKKPDFLNMSMRTCSFLAVFSTCLLTACASKPPEPVTQVKTVNVAVPVPCQIAEPKRPAMPMDSLKPGVTLDSFVAHALAEREIREGYEGELRAALRGCRAGK